MGLNWKAILGSGSLIATTPFRTVFNFIPTLFPFFPPSKRLFTNQTNFLGQISFLVCHRLSSWIHGSNDKPKKSNSKPESLGSNTDITFMSWDAVYSTVWRSSGLTPRWNGADRLVSVVPGCKPTMTTERFNRAHSIAKFFNNIFKAALLERLEYQPPSRLSLMLPTLAVKTPSATGCLGFSRARRHLISSAGPKVFIWSVSYTHLTLPTILLV